MKTTKLGSNGLCYHYRNHSILLTAALGYIHGEIRYMPNNTTNELVAEGFAGYSIEQAKDRIERRIDRDIKEMGD